MFKVSNNNLGNKLADMYKLEAQIIREFETIVSQGNSPLSVSTLAFEFNYQSGKADIIAITKTGELIAFEAKLKHWRSALDQAYRNSSFAHYSYVLLPNSACDNAVSQRHEFKRRRVGLCSISTSGVKVRIPAPKNEPLQPWLTDTAVGHINKVQYEQSSIVSASC